MSEIVYAVHTRACTYLLDEDGFCRWVLSRSGAKSDDRCVGAQFVAALDLRSKGGLVGELRIGAQALFIRSEDGRFALIRTKPIEHVEVRGAEAEGEGDPFGGEQGYGTEPEAEADPVVLPDHLAVAAVFDAPVPAPEPPPPSARVILQTHPQHAQEQAQPQAYAPHQAYTPSAYAQPASFALSQTRAGRTEPPPPIASPRTEPLPAMPSAPLPAPPPARAFPQPPPRENLQAAAHAFAEAHARPVVHAAHARSAAHEPHARSAAHEPHQPYGHDVRQSLPRATTGNPARAFPEPPPRQAPRAFPEPSRAGKRPFQDPSQETQPLPPAGPMPAWPPMLAPPPPQAEMMPLGPARPSLPSSEELDVDDLEEVGDDDQVYSMEVTLTLPLFRADQNLAQLGAPREGRSPGGSRRR